MLQDSVNSVPAPIPPDNFIYNYQNLIGALVALLVGIITVFFLWRQIDQQRRRQAEAALALCRMFYEEALLFGRFFVNFDSAILTMIGDKNHNEIASIPYPGKITFDSQMTRFSELDYRVALPLMYFYQSMMHLLEMSKRHRSHLSEGDAQLLMAAYDSTLGTLLLALEKTLAYLEQEKVEVHADNKKLVNEVRRLVVKETTTPAVQGANRLFKN